MPKCFFCEQELIWGGDFDSEDVGMDEEGVASNYSCPNCGALYDVFVPSKKNPEN